MNGLKSYTEYNVQTATTDFVIGFDFDYGVDAVRVTLDNVPATEAGYTVIYLNETTMRLEPAVPSGKVVRLQRETDIDYSDHAFSAGAKFLAQTMDKNFEQVRHAQQEVRDGFNKLSQDTYAIIDTLADVGEAAQDAAEAAQDAAQTANDAAAQVTNKVDRREGAALPYDESVEYLDGAITYKDNELQQLKDGQWKPTKDIDIIKTVESITDLIAIKNPRGGQVVTVGSYWSEVGKGGGIFTYDPNMPRNKHNGGTVIDPTKSWGGSREQWAFVDGYLPDVGIGVWGVDNVSKVTAEVKSAIASRGGNLALGSGLNPTNFRTNQIKIGGFLGASESSSFGCWVAKTKELSFTMFGAVGDAKKDTDGTDDSFAMLACVRALPKTGAVLNIENYYYTHGNGDIRNIVLHFMNFNNLTIKGNLATIQSYSDNLPTTNQAIIRFDFCADVFFSCLNTDGRLDSRMVVGGDPHTNNNQHNIYIGFGCKRFTLLCSKANRAAMDGIYIYGGANDNFVGRTEDIWIFNCSADYCYRQGSSHIVGLNIQYVGGSYSYTGTLPNPSGGTKGTAPMSGIDIEANDSDYNYRATYIVDRVAFRGNKLKGFIASNNSYGSITKSLFENNEYMGCYIEHNAMQVSVVSNNFVNNMNSIYNEIGANALIEDNTIYDVNNAINVHHKVGSFVKDYSKTLISKNKFITPDGYPQGGSITADYAKVVVSENTFYNVKPLWLGGEGNLFAEVLDNKYTNSLSSVAYFIQVWGGSRIRKISDNTVNLTSEQSSLLSIDNTTGTVDRQNNTINSIVEDVKIVDGERKREYSIAVFQAPTIPANSTIAIDYGATGVAPNSILSVAYNEPSGGVYMVAKTKTWGVVTVFYVNPTAAPVQIPDGYLRITI